MIHYDNMHQFNEALSGALKEVEEKGDLRSDDDSVKKVKELIATHSDLFVATRDIPESVSLIKNLTHLSGVLKQARDQDSCCDIAVKTAEQAFRFLSKDDIAGSLATLRELKGVDGGQKLYEESLGIWVSEQKIPIKSLGLSEEEMLSLAPHLTYLDLTDGEYSKDWLPKLIGCTFSAEFIGKLLNNSPNLNSLLIKNCKISDVALQGLPNPQRLLQLTVEDCRAFNQSLPTGLQQLKMNYCPAFNQSLPAGVQQLEMIRCRAFNRSLPATLQQLEMIDCRAFNRSLPAGVQQLKMRDCDDFNQSLPAGVQQLEMRDCDDFNQSLPAGVQQLEMIDCRSFNRSLPAGVQQLKMRGCDAFNRSLSELTGLQQLTMNYCRAFNRSLPAGLQQLTMKDCLAFNQSLPAGVQQLEMIDCRSFNRSLPAGVQQLEMRDCDDFNRSLPAGVQQLEMIRCRAFNRSLPATLQQLEMIDCPAFNRSLPATLQQLDMNYCSAFNQSLPEGLQQLTMKDCSAFNLFAHGGGTVRALLRTSREELYYQWRGLLDEERQQVIDGELGADRLLTLLEIDSDIKYGKPGEDTHTIELRVASLRDLDNYLVVLKDIAAFFPNVTAHLLQHRLDEMVADLEQAGIHLEYLPVDIPIQSAEALLPRLSPDTIAKAISHTPKEQRDRWLQESISYDRFHGDVVSVLRQVHQNNIEGVEGSALDNLGLVMPELLRIISLKTLAALAADSSSVAVALAYTPFMNDLQLAVVIPCLNVDGFMGHVKPSAPETHKGLLAHASSAQKMAYVDADPLSFPVLQKWGEEYHPSLIKLVESCRKDAIYEALERGWGTISNRVKPDLGVGYKYDSTNEAIDPRKVGQIPVTLARVKDSLNKNIVDPEQQQKIQSYCDGKLGEYETVLTEFQEIKETIDSLLRVEMPREFCDPLTSCTMKEPYKAPGGVVMDKTSWDIWFEEGNTTSPEIKGIVSDPSVKVSATQIEPCKELKESIETFGKEHSEEVTKANEALKRIELPEELYDPISGAPMEDPYKVPGGAMDKSGWDGWFASGKTSNPFAPREALSPKDIQRDNELRAKIRIFKTAHPEVWKKANE